MTPSQPFIAARATSDPLGGGPPPPETIRTDRPAIIGIAFTGALVIGCSIWLSIYFFLRRRRTRRERVEMAEDKKRIARKSAMMHVEEIAELASPAPRPREPARTKAVDRALITASVVMPEKAPPARPPASDPGHDGAQSIPLPPPIMLQPPSPVIEEIPRFPDVQQPPSSTLQEPPRAYSGRPGSSSRTASFISRSSPLRQSTTPSPSRASSFSTATSAQMFDEGQMGKVRQTFLRALPDELAVVHGEYLAIIRRYDDGWCVVGREARGGRPVDVEFGAVPGWVFSRPEEGVRPMRPVRNASLNVRVSLEAPGGPSFTWTNT